MTGLVLSVSRNTFKGLNILFSTMFCKVIVIVSILLVWSNGVNSYTYEDMGNLMDDLFNTTRYNKDVRPIVNQSDAVQINVTHMLYYIEDVKLTSGDLLTRSMMFAVWKDEMATWSPEDYGGIEKISVPKGKIWTPDIVSATGGLSSMFDYTFSFLYLKNTGIVLQATAGYFQTKCLMDSTYYPYDRHSCTFEYVCQHYDANEVILNSGPNMFLNAYTENNEWDVSHMKSESVVYQEEEFEAKASVLNLMFNVSRRPAYAAVSTVLPTLMLTIIFSFACFIPGNSGERLSFMTTLMMTIVFMYTAFVDIMPRDSLHLPYASISYIFLISMNTITTIWNVFVVRISTWSIGAHPIPRCFKRLLQFRVRKTSRKIANNSDTSENNDYDDGKDTDRNRYEAKPRDITWTDVADFLDKVAFVIQWIIFVAVTIGMNVILVNGKQQRA